MIESIELLPFPNRFVITHLRVDLVSTSTRISRASCEGRMPQRPQNDRNYCPTSPTNQAIFIFIFVRLKVLAEDFYGY